MLNITAELPMPVTATDRPQDCPARLEIPLRISIGAISQNQPVTFGVPLRRGIRADEFCWTVFVNGKPHAPCQTLILGRWPDGSCKWLLVTFLYQFTPDAENAIW